MSNKKELWKKYFKLVNRFERIKTRAQEISVSVDINNNGVDLTYINDTEKEEGNRIITEGFKIFNKIKPVSDKLLEGVDFKQN